MYNAKITFWKTFHRHEDISLANTYLSDDGNTIYSIYNLVFRSIPGVDILKKF